MQYKSFTVSEDWPPRFCKCEIIFDGGVRLGFSDPRRLGRILLRQNAVAENPIAALARDALLDPPTLEEFAEERQPQRNPNSDPPP